MNNTKRLIIFFCFVAISIVIGTYIKNRRKDLLAENTNTTYAVFEKTVNIYNTGPVSYFHYTIGKTKFNSEHYGRFSTLKKGDSVLIKYSLEDPSIYKVIDTIHVVDWDKKK